MNDNTQEEDSKTIKRKIQLEELEILKYVDNFCRNNDIKYSLIYGSLLGAVRHKGFIPWDDDIDICMERSQYETFLSKWKASKHDNYISITHEDIPNYPQNYAKIEKRNTTFLEFRGQEKLYPTGFFIDIFPYDRIPNNLFLKYIYFFNLTSSITLTQRYAPAFRHKTITYFFKVALKLTPNIFREKLRSYFTSRCKSYNSSSNLPLISNAVVGNMKRIYPPNSFDNYCDIDFEGCTFMCCNNYKELLTIEYGDYMVLPPPSERYTHNPLCVSYHKSLNDFDTIENNEEQEDFLIFHNEN